MAIDDRIEISRGDAAKIYSALREADTRMMYRYRRRFDQITAAVAMLEKLLGISREPDE